MADNSTIGIEEENFIRLYLITNSISTKVVKKVFDREFHPSCLQKELNKLHGKVHKLCKQQHVISKVQYELLYPLTGTAVSDTFDLSLMITLLRNFTNIGHPKKGFDQLPDDGEIKEADDLARLKYYRNYLSHKSETKIDNGLFIIIWKSVSEAVSRLGGPNFTQECSSLRFAPFSSTYLQIVERLTTISREYNDMRNETIPHNIWELNKVEIKRWEKENEIFVATEASQFVIDNIQCNSCVIIVGASGAGKSATAHHVALHLQNHFDYTIIPVKSAVEIKTYHNSARNQIFVVDDICGRYTVVQNDINEWLKYMETIEDILEEGNIKLLLTCRLQVYRESNFQRLKFLIQCECNISDQFSLSSEERLAIAQRYLSDEAAKIPNIDRYESFPLMCKFYSDNKQLVLGDFFNNPKAVYMKELQMLFEQSDKTKFCSLVLLVLVDNQLDETWLTMNENPVFTTMYNNACNECKLSNGTSKRLLQDHLDSFLHSYLKKINGIYTTIHDKIFDYLSCYIGRLFVDLILRYATYSFINQRCVLECCDDDDDELSITISATKDCIFFERLKLEMETGNLLGIFSNRQLKNLSYRKKFMKSLESITEFNLDNMLDEVDTTTVYSPLLLCCFSGYNDIIQFLIAHKADVNKRCIKDYDISPLYIACQQGHSNTAQLLLKNGADINMCLSNGSTPLYIACQLGYTKIVGMLLKRGADPNICRCNGYAPLHSACQEGHLEIARMLIKSGAFVNQYTYMIEPPIFMACQEGHIDIVQLLLDNNADVNASTSDSLSPLFIACQKGHVEIIKVLLRFKADVNKYCVDSNPLFEACHNGMDDVVKILLENGADVNFQRYDEATALFIACEMNYRTIVRLLLSYGADVNHKKDNESTPLFIACCNGYASIVSMLLIRNADLNICQCDASPLFAACNNGCVDTVKILVERGALVNKCTEDQTSPLFIACQEGYESIVAVLLKHGADFNMCRFNGMSPLYIACEMGYLSIVVMLLHAMKCTSSTVDDYVYDGATPLFIAAQNGHTEIIKVLIKYGADVNICRDHDTSPLFMACQEGHAEIVKILIGNGADVNVGFDDLSCLFVACRENHEAVVKMLLAADANVNSLTMDGISPIFVACENGNTDIVKQLLQKDTDIYQCIDDGTSPLFEASQEGFLEIATMLLDKDLDLQKNNADKLSEHRKKTTKEEHAYLSDIEEETDPHIQTKPFHISGATIKHSRIVDIRRNDGASPLFIACAEGQTDIVKQLLDHYANVDQCTPDGISPLYAACEAQNVDIVKMLLERNASVNKKSTKGKTPLYVACKFGCLEIIKLLKDKNAKVNKGKNNATTPLYVACKRGYLNIVEELIQWDSPNSSHKRYTDVNLARKDGNSPLFIACKNEFLDIVKVLIDTKCSINIQNRKGETPLFISTIKPNLQIAQVLLLNGADVDFCIKTEKSKCNTALFQACCLGYYEIVSLLMEYGANVNIGDYDHKSSPLFVACRNGFTEIVEKLLSSETIDADINRCSESGATPLFVACQGGYERIVCMLLRKQANVNTFTNTKATPLYIACECNHPTIVRLLLNNDADVNIYTTDDISPLHVACREGNIKIVKMLMKVTNKIDDRSKENISPIYAACAEGHTEVVTLLLDKGADVYNCSEDGQSCLFVAAQCGNIDIVQLLVEEHNLIDQYKNYETCPLYIACFNGFTNITQELTTLTEYSPEIKYRCLYTCCERGNKDTAKFLLERSFDPNDIDIDRNLRTTHLQIACENGHTDIVQLLLDYNAKIDKCNKDGESPLILATKHGYDGIVRLLLSKGACTNLSDGNGNTALSLADQNDFTDIVDLLRQKMFIR